ncbi:unnamed protein product, partial [marine sediment metagenome]
GLNSPFIAFFALLERLFRQSDSELIYGVSPNKAVVRFEKTPGEP